MIHTHTTHALALDQKLRRGKEEEEEEESVTERRDLHIKQERQRVCVKEKNRILSIG
jgi:hypothetical protein